MRVRCLACSSGTDATKPGVVAAGPRVHQVPVTDLARVGRYPRAMDLGTIVVIGIFVLLIVPVLARQALEVRRSRAFRALQRARGSRVIAMIHRQETVGVLGVPFYRYIDIDDSEPEDDAEQVPVEDPVHAGECRCVSGAWRARRGRMRPSRAS